MQVAYEKIAILSNMETTQDIVMLSLERKWQPVCDLSNGTIFNDRE